MNFNNLIKHISESIENNQDIGLGYALKGERPLTLTGYGKFINLHNISRCSRNKLADFVKSYNELYKSRKNEAIIKLEGELCRIKISNSGTSWNIFFGEGNPLKIIKGEWKTIPSLNTTNGAASEHYIALCNKSFAIQRINEIRQKNTKIAPSKLKTLEDIANS